MDFVANWLVQGCVVALATVVIVRCLPRALAATRYLVCWVGLSAVLTLPLVSLIPGALSQVQGVTVDTTASGALVSLPHSPTFAPLIIGAWLVWVAAIRRATRKRDGRDSTGPATLPFIPARPGAPPPQLDTSETPGPRRAARCLGRRAGSGRDWVWRSSHCDCAGTGSTPHGCRARSHRDSRVGTRAAAGRSRECRSAHGADARRVASGYLVARSMAASRARSRLRWNGGDADRVFEGLRCLSREARKSALGEPGYVAGLGCPLVRVPCQSRGTDRFPHGPRFPELVAKVAHPQRPAARRRVVGHRFAPHRGSGGGFA